MTNLDDNLLLGSDDIAFGFALEETSVRGQIVRLGPAAADEIISRHVLHPIIAKLLGELLVLSTIAGASLKFDGKLIAELRCEYGRKDLPVEFVVAEYLTGGTLRGMAKINHDAFATLIAQFENPNLNQLFGEGLFLMTIDQKSTNERYQGQIAIDGEDLSEVAKAYFEKSEQIPTEIRLECDIEDTTKSHKEWRACGIMIQKIADDIARGETDEDWNEATIKFNTLTKDEILDPSISAGELLFRLYHENRVVCYKPKLLAAKCNCSRERLVALMKDFPKEDTQEMIDGDGQIHARCEYCNTTYRISPREFR